LSIGDGSDTIGDTWAGSGEDDAKPPRKRSIGVCHVDGSPLVAHVNNPHPTLRELIPNRLNMSPLQTEYPVHPAGDQKFSDKLGD
jgi:hypothetical protein